MRRMPCIRHPLQQIPERHRSRGPSVPVLAPLVTSAPSFGSTRKDHPQTDRRQGG
jgi:hypothetical protein